MDKPTENCQVRRWDLLRSELKNLNAAEARVFLANGSPATLIDCRKPTEVAELRLPRALNIDYLAYDFWEKVTQLPRDGVYFVYCNSGRRSARVCTLMKNGGFLSVYNLNCGLQEWVQTLGDEELEKGLKTSGVSVAIRVLCVRCL